MRVPLEWLKAYVTIRLSPEALADRLTMAGLEVTSIERVEGQPVLDIEITPNRADCLSIIGVAREIAAITGQRLKLPLGARGQGPGARQKRHPGPRSPAPGPFTIRIEDRKGCPRYIGRLIKGVTVGPSPSWMQRRLIACGARPINNVVDITNYVLLEFGQPLHAFDADQLARQAIIVRRARTGERITALDGVARVLSPDILVIADAERPVAIAGIVGGGDSAVQEATTRVVLESAHFDAPLIRRAGRTLGVTTESSYRFERGIDPVGVETASIRAASLIRELASGQERLVRDVGTKPAKRTVIAFEPVRASRLLGIAVSPTDARTRLATLGCRVASGLGAALQVEVPSFRRDLAQAADLTEELARLIGYDRIPATLPTFAVSMPTPSAYRDLRALRTLCAALGLTETVSWSLVSAHELAACRLGAAVRLTNPLSRDHALVRPALLLGLLSSVRRNLAQGAASVRLFELGQVVVPGAEPMEHAQLGIAIAGVWTRDWQAQQRCDFFRLKGLVTALAQRWCGQELGVETATLPWAEAGHAAMLHLGRERVGEAGEVSAAVREAWEIDQPVWVGMLEVEQLLAQARRALACQPLIAVPSVKRDLSILVSNETSFVAVEQTIREVAGRLATRVELVDYYTDLPVQVGHHSLTFSIEYRDPTRTLTAAEVDALHQRIGQTLVSRFGAQIR